MTIRQRMTLDAQAHNRWLTEDVCAQKTDLELLRNVHPRYRTQLARELYKEGRLTQNEVKEFINLKD